MSLATMIRAIKRGTSDEVSIEVNETLDLLVAQDMPSGAELTRKGERWATMSTGAVAGLVVRPTTVAAFEIFNNYPVGGKSLVVERLFYFNLVSTNVVEGFSGWAMVSLLKASHTNGSFAVTSLSGKPSYTLGPVVAAASTTVVDNGWYPQTEAYQKGAGGVVPFGAVIARVNGNIIVPPQCSLCLHVVSSLVGQTFTQGAEWVEKQLTLL